MLKSILKTIVIPAVMLVLSAATACSTPEIGLTIDLFPGSAPKNLAIAETLATTTVYITNSASSSITIIPFGEALNVLTLDGGTANPWDVAVYDNAVSPKAYVTNKSSGTVSVIDISGGANVEVTGAGYPIVVGGLPMGIAANNSTNKIYVANNNSDTVSIINGATGLVSKTLTGFGGPYDVAVNSVTNKIYVTNNETGTLRVINGATDVLASSISLNTDPRGVTVDTTRNLVYVVTGSSSMLYIIDGSTDTVITSIALPSTPEMIDVTPESGLLYITAPSTGRLYTYRSTSPYSQVTGSPLSIGAGAYGIATFKASGGEPWRILATAPAVDDLLYIQETDTYAPTFNGLVRAVDGAMSIASGGPAIDLYWDAAADSSIPITYGVYIASTTGGQNFATVPFYSTTAYGTVTITASSLEYATSYYIVVRASDSAITPNSDSNVIERSVYVTDGAAPAGGELTSAVDGAIGGQVTLSWTAAVDDTPPVTYNIYAGNATSSMPLYTTSLSATGVVLTGLTNDLIHYFLVRAEDASGLESANTTILSVTPTDSTPPSFLGLNAASNVMTGGTVNLTWTAATDGSLPITYVGYIEIGTSVAFSTAVFTTTNTSYTVAGLTNGVGYAFGVRARDGEGNYDSNTVVRTATPTDVAGPDFDGISSCADAGSDGDIRLIWSPASDNSPPIYYNIYQSTSSGGQNFASWDYRVTATNTYLVTGLTNGQKYYFVVRAVDSATPANEESNTTEMSATPTDGVVPVFSGLSTATPTGNTGEISLSWTAATDTSLPVTYKIYRSLTSGSYNYSTPSYTITGATTYTATGLADGTRYYFVVRAQDAAGLMETNTTEKSAIPNDGVAPVFGGITGLTDAQTSGKLNVSWSAGTDLSNPITYEIFAATTSGSQTFSSPWATTTSTSAAISGLANNIPYYVVVRARDSGGVTEYNTTELFATPTDQTAPAFAGVISATDRKLGGDIELNWNAGTDNSTPLTYYVFVRIDPATYDYSTTPYYTQYRPYSVTGLTDGVTYRFNVGVRDNASPTQNFATNAVELVATPTDQTAPTFSGISLAADAHTNGAINIAWPAASDRSGISYYKIYYATNTTNFWATYQATISGTATNTQITGLDNNRLYYFAVRAVDNSSYANTDTNTARLTTYPTDTTVPSFGGLTGATDTALGSSIQLSWDAATDPSTPITYNIYYSVSSNPSFTIPKATTSNSTGVILFGLTNNLPYYFTVRAKDAAGNETTNTAVMIATPTDNISPTFAGLASSIDTETGGEALLSWTAATDYSQPVTYEIYQATTFGGQNFAASPTYTSTGTSYTVTGLTNGQNYFHVVRARDAAGNIETNTTELTVTPSDQTAPVFASLQTAQSATEGQAILLSWPDATDRSTPITYNVYLATFPGAQNFSSASFTTSATSTKVTGLTNKIWYYVVVRAADGATPPNSDTNTTERSVMPTDTLGPSAPTGVSAIPGDVTSTPNDEYVRITWTAPTTSTDETPLTDLAGFNVYRSPISGTYPSTPQNKIDGIDNDGDGMIDSADTNGDLILPGDVTYDDTTNIVSGTKYYYVVTAADTANPRNQSPYSSEVSATPKNADNAIPNAPDNLSAISGDGYVTVRWDAPTQNTDSSVIVDLQGYKLYRSTTSGGNYVLISTATLLVANYTDYLVTNNTRYYYVVTAIDTANPPNESAYSTQISAMPAAMADLAPAPPTELSITAASGSAQLTWRAPTTNSDGSPLSDLAGYNVYRNTSATGAFTQVNSSLLTNPTYNDTGLINGTTYYYYVTALDTSSKESASSSVSFAVYGSKGVSGLILARDMAGGTVGTTGYPLVGIEGVTVQLLDQSDTVLGTGVTDNTGAYKIVYEDAQSTQTYKARAVITEISGYLPDKDTMSGGIGYRSINNSITILTGFVSLKTLYLGQGPAVADANCDGSISMRDFNVLKAAFGKSEGQSGYNKNADFNGDEIVNMKDFNILKENFSLTAGTAPSSALCNP